MVNPNGANGIDNGTRPDDETLKAALVQYASEGLTRKQQLDRLDIEFNYRIELSSLRVLKNTFAIPSVRKPPPVPVATALVLEEMAQDTNRRNGPTTIKKLLAVNGHQIPRSTVRQVMADNNPTGAAHRYPGSNKLPRSHLKSHGPWAELSCDGHEKFASTTLGMGPVGIPVYGQRDKWAGPVLTLRAVPNARKAVVIGHLYLDFVREHGAIPMQITVDHGSETGDMYALHTALRRNYAPDLDEEQWPPFVALKSTHNIRIESIWKEFRKQSGRNIQDALLQGRSNGFFNPNNIVHTNLFQWLWPPIVQTKLDAFKTYWNCHRVRKQSQSLLPSGGTPMDFFVRPHRYGGERLSIPVPVDVVDELRKTLPISREEAFKWVDDEFAAAAEEVYAEIGSPERTLSTGWAVFARMTPLLHAMYDNDPTLV